VFRDGFSSEEGLHKVLHKAEVDPVHLVQFPMKKASMELA
jgi:hypothetical protein